MFKTMLLATRCSRLYLRCCARRDSMVRCFATRWTCAAAQPAPEGIAWYIDLLHAAAGGSALLGLTRLHGTLLCYTLQRAGPAQLLSTSSHGMLLCYLQRAESALLRSPLDEFAWYIDLLHTAVSRACASHAAAGWACAAAPDEIAWHVALLQAAVG